MDKTITAISCFGSCPVLIVWVKANMDFLLSKFQMVLSTSWNCRAMIRKLKTKVGNEPTSSPSKEAVEGLKEGSVGKTHQEKNEVDNTLYPVQTITHVHLPDEDGRCTHTQGDSTCPTDALQ